MNIVASGLLFLLGAGVGSFITAQIFRTKKNKRSHCDNCNNKLAWSDLVPVLSYILLKGECRYCKKKIKKTYFIIEVVSGCLFASSYLFLGFLSGQLLIWLIILSLMISLFLDDLFNRKMFFSQIAILTGFCILFTLLTDIVIEQKTYSILMIEHILALIPLTILFCTVYFISKEKLIGLGDILLSIPLGILLSWQGSLFVLLLSSIFGIIYYFIVMFQNKTKVKTKIPFGSFLILATIIFFVVKPFVNLF